MIPDGGIFQASQGEKEQHEGMKGFTAITASETDLRFSILIRGDSSSPSQVFVGGNSRKSSLTISFSIVRHIVLRVAPA